MNTLPFLFPSGPGDGSAEHLGQPVNKHAGALEEKEVGGGEGRKRPVQLIVEYVAVWIVTRT
jgi:hypothetical protein